MDYLCVMFYPVPCASADRIVLQEQQQIVIDKCVMAEPRHGQLWQIHAKDPKNWGKKIPDILQIVAASLE